MGKMKALWQKLREESAGLAVEYTPEERAVIESTKKERIMKIKEYRLVDKDGAVVYKSGTLYEVSAYALENQLLLMTDKEGKHITEEDNNG